ncbi:hypothetical protein L0F63_002131 [Massospora cicadina]|nr:hypothetical protein L0F63_002131 [Massospora cicadina]
MEPDPRPLAEAPTAITEPQVTSVVETAAPLDGSIDSYVTDGNGLIEPVENVLSGQDSRDRPFKVVLEEEATVLLGHASEVYICSWNPIFPTHIATGSNDGGGRVWRLPRSSKSDKILSHYMGFNSNDPDRDIVAIDWHPKGTVLATGSYDGYVRQFTHSGWLRFQGDGHSSPCCRGGMDMTARIWCSAKGIQLQQLTWHTDAVVDVAWKCENIFATCSNDGLIFIGQFEEPDPLYTFSEHKMSVNAIRWDPTGTLLASCSDDMSIKARGDIFKQTSLMTLVGHDATISAIAWSPDPIGPNASHLLATASDDKTVRLWDVLAGTTLFTLSQHTERISSITFSPDSKYLASSAFDSAIHIFSTENGKLVKSFLRQGHIFDIKWSPCGESLAACFADSSVPEPVAVFDLSK